MGAPHRKDRIGELSNITEIAVLAEESPVGNRAMGDFTGFLTRSN